MKVWNYSTKALAALLSVVSLTSAGGPADGEAVADPNSAVVQLTTENFEQFIQENPLVLAEFFAPWCGYCKILAPEFSKAADSLNETHPNIKLAQVDCTKEESICQQYQVQGYPTMKVLRGDAKDDYEGPRDAEGIKDYMIKQSLPAVRIPESWDDLQALIKEQTRPFVVQLNCAKDDEENDSLFNEVASQLRKDFSFFKVSESKIADKLAKLFTNVKVGSKKLSHVLIHPNQLDDVREFVSEELNAKSLVDFIQAEAVPYFGDITRETYMTYMTSPLPLGYYFYNTQEEREQMLEGFNKLGKQYKGKLNFVGLDATQYGKHAEVISMDPSIVPFFAIQDMANSKKFGIDQAANPNGPDLKTIEQFVKDYFNDKLQPIVKSEPLPTEEEVKANPVFKLVGHNHEEVLKDLEKDIFVKYYAPWCGHCKKLAPIWEDLGEIFNGNSDVLIADIDHSNNDVVTPLDIEGYPTLVLYPANGELDEKTGLRKPVVFSGARDLESLIKFVKDEGALKVDGGALKSGKEDAAADILEDDVVHDEL